jgi:LacI family transcriptional regulator
MATLKDIAEKVGVTPKTVSAVLNDRYQATHPKAVARADRIRKTARELGYRPNAAARAAQAGRFGSIGILMSTSGKHSILTEVIGGIQQAVTERQLGLRFCSIPDENIDDRHIGRLLQQLCVDGVLVNYTHEFPPQLLALLEQHSIPAVWVNTKQPHDCVHADDYAAGKLGVEKLIQLGHRKIAYVTHTFRQDGHYSAIDRCAGYQDAMRQTGLSPVMLDYGIHAPNVDRDAILMPWLQEVRPTAVHTQSLSEAIGVYSAAEKLGLRIPADLSILTIQPEEQAALGIQFDAVRLASTRVGKRGVELLAEKIADPHAQLQAESIPSYLGKWKAHSCAPPTQT